MTNDEIIKRLEAIATCELVLDEQKIGKITKQAFEAIQETAMLAIFALKRDRWISVEERMPESSTRALVMRFDYVTNTPFYDLLWFDKDEWWNRRFSGDYAVTHWMPLPEPPKEE